MARANKQGIEYFPLNVKLDNKFKFLQAKHGLEGFAVAIKLLQLVYSEGYWANFGEDEMFMFASNNKIDNDHFRKILDTCLDKDIFSDDLFKKYHILTSHGIQKQYKEVVKRRKDVEIVDDYLLNVDIMHTSCQHHARKSTQRETERERETEKETDKETETEKEPEPVVVVVDENMNIFTDYAKAGFGIASSTQADRLMELEETYGYEWTSDAIKEAAINNILRITYVEGILKNWKAKGRNAQKPQYKNGKEVKKDFNERTYDYKEEEVKLLGWDKPQESKVDGEDILKMIRGGTDGDKE